VNVLTAETSGGAYSSLIRNSRRPWMQLVRSALAALALVLAASPLDAEAAAFSAVLFR